MKLVADSYLICLCCCEESDGTNFKVQGDQFGSRTSAVAFGEVVLVLQPVVGWPQFEEHVEVMNFVVVAVAAELVLVPLYFFENFKTEHFSSISEHVAGQHEQNDYNLDVVQSRQLV